MLDDTMRMAVAYGLIALMGIAAVMVAWWLRRNTWRRRNVRERDRNEKRSRQRAAATAVAECER